MIGFFNISNTFSLAAIQALQVDADTLYVADEWIPIPLPASGDWIDVTTRGVANNGTDCTNEMNALANDTSVTNWYFPSGTYLMGLVQVPSHVQFIHGVGTIRCIDPGLTEYHKGALLLNMENKCLSDNFVMDGLNFDAQDSASDQSAYGIVTIDHGEPSGANVNSFDHLEVRNCTWDSVIGGGGDRESLKIMAKVTLAGETEQFFSNMRIYGNIFNGTSGHFDLEVGTFTHGNPFRLVNSYPACHIHDNSFVGAGSGLSFVNVWCMGGLTKNSTTSYVYNNSFSDKSWGIELGANNGVHVHNNYMTGIRAHPITTTTNYNENTVPYRRNYIYNNHLEGVYSEPTKYYGACQVIYSDTSDWWGNFIKGQVRFKLQDLGYLGPVGDAFGHFSDNTVVGHDNATSEFRPPILIAGRSDQDFVTGTIETNDIYGGEIYADGILVSYVTTDVEFINNNIYLPGDVPDNPCITVGEGTQTGNNCVHNFTGTVPTGRDGAGLLP